MCRGIGVHSIVKPKSSKTLTLSNCKQIAARVQQLVEVTPPSHHVYGIKTSTMHGNMRVHPPRYPIVTAHSDSRLVRATLSTWSVKPDALYVANVDLRSVLIKTTYGHA